MTSRLNQNDHWESLPLNINGTVSKKWPDIPAINKPSPGGRTCSPEAAGFVYSGLKQEIVPQRLLLDSRLTPLERNGWLVFKMLLDKQGYAVPRYQDLQPYLAQTPYGEQASRETVSRIIAILRMTRWISLLAQGRDSSTGRIVGNMYILHEDPVTAQEAAVLDPSYAELVTKNLHHNIKSVRIVAEKIAEEMDAETGATMPTRLDVLQQRIQSTTTHVSRGSESERGKITLVRNPNPVKKPSSDPSSESELSKKSLVRNNSPLSSDSELGRKATKINAVRNPNYSTSTVLSTYTSTVLYIDPEGKKHHSSIKWPEHLDDHIREHERRKALSMLEYQEPDLQQEIINELAARCQQGGIKKPLGYLRGLVRKAERGEFKLWSGQNQVTTTPTSKPNHAAKSLQKTSPHADDFERIPIDELPPEGKAGYLAIRAYLDSYKSSRKSDEASDR